MNRDDLFTSIHKALRLGLFELTAAAGRTDWDSAEERAELEARWRPFLSLLRSHTEHEDNHILRILDTKAPETTAPAAAQHVELELRIDRLEAVVDTALGSPSPATGLAAYRELALFTAAYLPHLHDEETTVMARIWELCTDEEIAATRVAFMADLTPEIRATSMEWMLPAIDRPTREAMLQMINAN